MTKPKASTDTRIQEMAERHFDSYNGPFLTRFAAMHKIEIDKAEWDFIRFNYVTSAIHFAKHQRGMIEKEVGSQEKKSRPKPRSK